MEAVFVKMNFVEKEQSVHLKTLLVNVWPAGWITETSAKSSKFATPTMNAFVQVNFAPN